MADFDKKAPEYDAWYKTQKGALVDALETECAFSLFTPAPGMRVLDAGCGTGNFSMKMAALGAHVEGIDLSAPMIGYAQEKAAASEYSDQLHFQLGDLYQLPFPDLAAADTRILRFRNRITFSCSSVHFTPMAILLLSAPSALLPLLLLFPLFLYHDIHIPEFSRRSRTPAGMDNNHSRFPVLSYMEVLLHLHLISLFLHLSSFSGHVPSLPGNPLPQLL